jgi:DNA-binding response OmpR family regulator
VAHAAEDTDSFAVGPLLCEPLERALYNAEGDEVARLTDKELKLLSVLAGADGAVVTREALLEAVWGYKAELDTHTLETHIYRLRQKVEADPAAPLVLLTAEGGYRLEGAS